MKKIIGIAAGFLALSFLLALSPQSSHAVLVDFDALTGSSAGTPYPGNTFSAQGVEMTTGDIPDIVAVNDIIVFSNPEAEFLVFDSFSVSFPNIASPSGGCQNNLSCTKDLLFTFAGPVSTVSLVTDVQVGLPTPVRLMALAATGTPNQFRVLAIDETLDQNGGDVLVVAPGSDFQFAVFQTVSEREGFDNLDFQFAAAVPGLPLLGLVVLAIMLSVVALRFCRAQRSC